MLTSLLVLCCAAGLAVACESTDPQDDISNSPRGNILLTDANNYRSTSSLDIPKLTTISASDLDICWADLTDDIQCHDVQPTVDVDNVAMLRVLHLDEAEVEAKLANGDLAQSEIDGYLDYNTAEHASTCIKLSDMTLFGTPIDVEEEYVETADRTYLLLFTQGTTPGVGALNMMFVEPSATSATTEVRVGPGCGVLDFAADLSTLTPAPIPKEGPWVVDWRDVTTDGQGRPIDPRDIDGIMIGFYEGMNLVQLQDRILDLEEMATTLWRLSLPEVSSTANIGRAVNQADGTAFAGFEAGEGLWIMGLMCDLCQNPAPLLLTIFEPAPRSAP
ncbi:MAG: hypothetical protein V3V08_14910 [Nannocystaceae bacterium]